ncbi:MAG: M15 family metallopeptidase [Sulfurovaceae bacterium]|nr:M15 family metallopeptidase [Sulfurovaceae bacterium]
MKKTILMASMLLLTPAFAEFQAHIYDISPNLKNKMIKDNSWRKGCPVDTVDLRYLKLTHINFEGEDMVGELIVHKDISDDMVSVLRELYAIGYPINQMKLVSDFKGNDWQSIEAGNTSAFNCRKATGSKKWSKHSYGRAIDINPIENPYVSRKGYISHKASIKYKKRRHIVDTPADKAVLLKNDEATLIFKKYGFSWGGDWRTVKDYQHFVKD